MRCWKTVNKRPITNNPIILVDTVLNSDGMQIKFLRLTRRDDMTEIEWSKVMYWKYAGKLPKGISI